MIDISPYRKLRRVDLPTPLQHYVNETGGEALMGDFGPCIFTVTQDRDGHTEVSLSNVRNRLAGKPSDVISLQFLHLLKPQPVSWMETQRPQSYVRHWVLRLRKEMN